MTPRRPSRGFDLWPDAGKKLGPWGEPLGVFALPIVRDPTAPAGPQVDDARVAAARYELTETLGLLACIQGEPLSAFNPEVWLGRVGVSDDAAPALIELHRPDTILALVIRLLRRRVLACRIRLRQG